MEGEEREERGGREKWAERKEGRRRKEGG